VDTKPGKYTLRRYLMFQALIQGVPNPSRAVDRLFRKNPGWDEKEVRSWEGWRSDFVPTYMASRSVEHAQVKEGIL
jgi:hypothetical protein